MLLLVVFDFSVFSCQFSVRRLGEFDSGAVEEEGFAFELFEAEVNSVEVVFAEVFDLQVQELVEAVAGGVELEVLDVATEERWLRGRLCGQQLA